VGATSRGEEVVRRRQDTGAGEAGDDRHGTAARIGDKGEERGGSSEGYGHVGQSRKCDPAAG
jgi:hypothetical protein